MTIKDQLKKDWDSAANNYLAFFCGKHNFDFEDARNSWVGGRVGEMVRVADYYVDMTTIRTDIDRDAPEGEFIKWYDYTLRLGMIDIDIPIPNFDHWLMGAPRKSREEIAELEAAYQREAGTFSPKCVGCE